MAHTDSTLPIMGSAHLTGSRSLPSGIADQMTTVIGSAIERLCQAVGFDLNFQASAAELQTNPQVNSNKYDRSEQRKAQFEKRLEQYSRIPSQWEAYAKELADPAESGVGPPQPGAETEQPLAYALAPVGQFIKDALKNRRHIPDATLNAIGRDYKRVLGSADAELRSMFLTWASDWRTRTDGADGADGGSG
jgi:hypothetical protein